MIKCDCLCESFSNLKRLYGWFFSSQDWLLQQTVCKLCVKWWDICITPALIDQHILTYQFLSITTSHGRKDENVTQCGWSHTVGPWKWSTWYKEEVFLPPILLIHMLSYCYIRHFFISGWHKARKGFSCFWRAVWYVIIALIIIIHCYHMVVG